MIFNDKLMYIFCEVLMYIGRYNDVMMETTQYYGSFIRAIKHHHSRLRFRVKISSCKIAIACDNYR